MSRGDCPARGASGRSNGGVSGRCIVSLWRSMLFRAGACPPERTVRGFERVHPGPLRLLFEPLPVARVRIHLDGGLVQIVDEYSE